MAEGSVAPRVDVVIEGVVGGPGAEEANECGGLAEVCAISCTTAP